MEKIYQATLIDKNKVIAPTYFWCDILPTCTLTIVATPFDFIPAVKNIVLAQYFTILPNIFPLVKSIGKTSIVIMP